MKNNPFHKKKERKKSKSKPTRRTETQPFSPTHRNDTKINSRRKMIIITPTFSHFLFFFRESFLIILNPKQEFRLLTNFKTSKKEKHIYFSLTSREWRTTFFKKLQEIAINTILALLAARSFLRLYSSKSFFFSLIDFFISP